jgi:hypothetical protein
MTRAFGTVAHVVVQAFPWTRLGAGGPGVSRGPEGPHDIR